MGTILGLIRGDGVAGREPQPRAADIETLVRKARDTGVPVEFSVHGDPPPLPAAVELSMYRIAQEGLTNAMRHAPSAPVRVGISYREQSVLVEVVNDAGRGGSDRQAGQRARPDRAGRAGGDLRRPARRPAAAGGRLAAGGDPAGGPVTGDGGPVTALTAAR